MEPRERLPSPKRASRRAASMLVAGEAITAALTRQLEQTSQHDPSRHESNPRAIETKPERFAIEAYLIDQVADATLEGEGYDITWPALQARRDIPSRTRPEGGLLKLAEDLYMANPQATYERIVDDPKNSGAISRLHEIVEDIATDPGAKESYMHTETGRDEALSRINIGGSVELEFGCLTLIAVGKQLLERAYPQLSADERRKVIIDNITLLEQVAQLEINHASSYVDRWLDVASTPEGAAITLQEDFNGKLQLKISRPAPKPAKAEGRPVGCPAGYELGTDGEPVASSAIKRFATGFINEAYARCLV